MTPLSYELSVFTVAGKSLRFFPTAPSPYGEFIRGHEFSLDGKRMTIQHVAHTIEKSKDGSHISRTAIYLSPFHPFVKA